jgi:hypothetical protein
MAGAGIVSAGIAGKAMPSATAAFAVLGIDVSITVMVVLGSNSGINFMRPTVACTRNRAASQLKSDRVFREPRPHVSFWSLRDANKRLTENESRNVSRLFVIPAEAARERESRHPRARTVAPVQARGRLWTPAFASVTVAHCKTAAPFSFGR